ncbi:microfibrillar-associated protein 1-like [Homalodisca vitripennis]|uniref:microfibrillar-associated protein 1-like n=1 Tax=Homalodisca vitripennis TaxID=197043 RepID=UPI001EEAB869|nr:microfibrillar-associated protein 1-like [Homalodisca vitripennis]
MMMMNPNPLPAVPAGIQSTAGAVPVKNDKGELSMQKVKVHRYVSGKRPEYAPVSSSEEESEEEDFVEKRVIAASAGITTATSRSKPLSEDEEDDDETHVDDPRLRRLKGRRFEDSRVESDEETKIERHRHIHEPEILDEDESDDERARRRRGESSEEEEEEDELSDEEIERRRLMLRQKVLERKDDQEVEILDKEDEGHTPEESAEESSEYEEYSDSEEETGPRLKPVFVRKKDRVTVIEKEKEKEKQKLIEIEAKKMAEERRRYTLKMVEEEIRKDSAKPKGLNDEPALNDVNTDDENDEVEYEAWKLRELKRIKRDREEREALEQERLEIERMRNMSEEDRRQELRNNQKIITNKATKGKYKFMQKYYHRGAFFLDNENEIFKRDFSAATLEDHFDKTILPKVMQVKNFGRSGRTKYTHLVDQDTTHFESPWVSETAQNLKFHHNQAAGMKQLFEKPSVYKRKQT